MKRINVIGLGFGLLGLWGFVGCTPAGSTPKDDSFTLQSPAAERRTGEPTESPVATSKPEPEKAASGDGRTIVLGEKLTLTAPAHWVPKAPAMQMIAYEFAVPAVEGDSQDGRVTVMTAGGTVEANITRWAGQFAQPDGSETKTKTEKKTVAGQEVHLVDLAGTYNDSRGPFSPAVARPDYRMLAAIIPTSDGSHFIKFYGPKKTVGENEQAFRGMIEGMK
jgi:hypothetical protein